MLGIGVFLFWLAFRNMEWQQIVNAVESANYFYVSLAVFIMVLSHIVRGMRWTMLIRPLGFNPSIRNSSMAVFIGYLANLALPRMGEISRCVVLNRTDKVPMNSLIGTVITERLIDVVSLMLVLALNFFLEFGRLSSFFNEHVSSKLTNGAADMGKLFTAYNIIIILVVLVGLIIGSIVLINKIKHLLLVKKVLALIKGFLEGIAAVTKMKKAWLFIFYTILLWSLYYLTIYVGFYAMGIQDKVGLVAALTLLVMGSFGFVAPVQGGIGAYHWAVSAGLMLYGFTQADGLSFAFVMHTFTTLTIIVFGGISFLMLTLLYKKIKVTDELPSAD